MNKTLQTAHSKIFRDHIRDLRNRAQMSQRDFAKAIGREHGMIARIELGERRVDVVEFFQLMKALGVSPEKEAAKLMRAFDRVPD